MYHCFLHFSTILDSYSKDGEEALRSPSWKHCQIPLPCHREPSSHHSLAKEWQRIQRRAPDRRHQGERLIFWFVGDVPTNLNFSKSHNKYQHRLMLTWLPFCVHSYDINTGAWSWRVWFPQTVGTTVVWWRTNMGPLLTPTSWTCWVRGLLLACSRQPPGSTRSHRKSAMLSKCQKQ